jgi:hypothetical protein
MAIPDAGGTTFRYARGKLVWYALGSFACAGLSAWVAYMGLAPQGSFKEAVIWAAIPLFALSGVMNFRQMRDQREILRIAPDGITDLRIAPQSIPWDAIRNISIRKVKGQGFIVLHVEPEAEVRVSLSGVGRWSRSANAALGLDGLVLTPAGLDGSCDEVMSALRRYAPIRR